MALRDDLTDYIGRNSSPNTKIVETHNVAIVGEWHAFLITPGSDIRTRATVRLLLELLGDPKYRYFANESYANKGPIRQAVREYVQDGSLPPALDPNGALSDVVEIGRRVLVRRYQEVLDFLRANPRYILSIGTLEDADGRRDARLAQHFFEEFEDRKLRPGVPGVLLLGGHHAAAVSDSGFPTVRVLLEKRGFRCVSIQVLTDFSPKGVPDDEVIPVGTDLANVDPKVIVRLTSLVSKTPVTVPTDRPWTNGRSSPFRQVTFGSSTIPVASQFEYIVLQKA
jgi:hypothetical protein